MPMTRNEFLAFETGWNHGSITQEHVSLRQAAERFPAWDNDQLAMYLNGRDDGVAGDSYRLAQARAIHRNAEES